MSIPRRTIERIVALALEEDLGAGDVTTAACVVEGARGSAEMRAREPLVFCGEDLLREVFRQIDPELSVDVHERDGSRFAAGGRVATIEGWASSILQGERVALNFVQRMSAVATRTAELVAALP